MKILVVSDTHRSFGPLYDLAEREKPDLLLHLGDGESDVDDLQAVLETLPVRAVAGNCDYSATLPDRLLFEADGVRILMTHGHRMGVRQGCERLLREAVGCGAQLALFGHTHCQHLQCENGIVLMNPGSLTHPRDGAPGYGVITIQQQTPQCRLHRL